jgi:hypothetical protein
MKKRIAARSPPIRVEMATWAPGGQLDWWVKSTRHAGSGGDGYAVPTVGSDRSKLVIFVLRADHNATDNGVCRSQDAA